MGYSWGKKKPRIQTRRGRTICAGGCSGGSPRWHHSGEEADYCNYLMMLQKADEIREYKTQVRYDLKDAIGKPVGYMVVDFEVINNDGHLSIHEYKGAGFMKSQEFRQKRALFTWNYPDIPYHTVGKRDIVIL